MKNAYAIPVISLIVLVAIVVFITGSGFFSRTFSTSTQGLPDAQSPQAVDLKNGDTFTLTASIVKKTIAGATVKMLAYNGSIPGPLLKIPQGANVTINFKNETDVPSTLHSHGVRVDNGSDGVPTTDIPAVQPGGMFSYHLKFPDVGMYWYHPHVREDYAQELGLYGNYLVVPSDANYWSPVNREVALFLDDVLIENGAIAPFDIKQTNYTLMGRYGNVMLINGDDNYSLQVQRGEVIRFYITNSANVRPFKFRIAGAKMKLVGGDNGAYEKDQWIDSTILAPSERVIVEVLFDKPGSHDIQNATPDKSTKLGTIVVSNESTPTSYAKSFSVQKTHADVVKSIDPFRAYFAKQPDKQLKLTVDLKGNMQGMGAMMGGSHKMPDGTMMSNSMMRLTADGIEWEDTMQMMNQMSTTDNVAWSIVDEATGKRDADIDWKFKVGDKVKIRIVNDGNSAHPMQHPIHFHGQRFLVLNKNGIEQKDLVWKDTMLVPAGQYVDILLDASNLGIWMAHCHIAEHLEDGMMFMYTVE